MIQTIAKAIHNKQFIRYLMVGTFNTLFGLGLYYCFLFLLKGHVNRAYLIASPASGVIAIGVAFFGHKFIVFRSKGNILHELIRCYMVYGVTMFVSWLMLLAAVEKLHINPYLAQPLVIGITTIGNFLGHKFFSFRQKTC